MDPYQRTFQTWNKLASLYQEKFMDLDLYDDTYDAFCRLVPQAGARIFEIGCGPGNITRYLLSKRPDFRIQAIDVAPNMVLLARENNPTAAFSVMDCRDIDQLKTTFDAIVCGFCMPYLSKEDCAKLIKDCSTLLGDHGIFYFSAIEGDYARSGYETSSKGGPDKAFVYYHQADFLQEKLQEHGFELVDLIRKPYRNTPDSLSTHIIFIAGKT